MEAKLYTSCSELAYEFITGNEKLVTLHSQVMRESLLHFVVKSANLSQINMHRLIRSPSAYVLYCFSRDVVHIKVGCPCMSKRVDADFEVVRVIMREEQVEAVTELGHCRAEERQTLFCQSLCFL